MARNPLAWQPLLRHWCYCIGEGEYALSRLGQLEALEGFELATLLPGGPGWVDVQRCLRYDPEGAFRILYYSLALRGLEALLAPEQLVAADSGERPQVTVLIPVHDHWPITLNCLRSLVAMANLTRFEVIVADDASTDATTQLGRQMPWLRMWRSEQNQGFLDTCNGAAVLARGELLLLLNNDTLVGDHALDRIWDSFQRHPEAGVVGAAMWGADGLPQEVGGTVWADGEVWNHGRGFKPDLWFALNYERQTDYVSGCALAIRRNLWEELGGFDPRYRPAYCEDTDLCMRVWERGDLVLVQPQARILHMEGLSHSRSTEQGLKAHQVSNLALFRQVWQERLDLRQPPQSLAWLQAADRELFGRPLAVLLQPSNESIAICREKGYGVLTLGESSLQPDVLCVPHDWHGLEAWLLDQLPEQDGPEIVLVGSGEDFTRDLAMRLRHARSHWQLLASAADLAARPRGMRLPALPGWDQEDLRLLASSSGLHADGWLETSSRLVIQLVEQGMQAESLRLGLFLPEQGLQPGDKAVVFMVEPELASYSFDLQAGLNHVELRLPVLRDGSSILVKLSSAPLVRPANASDKRRLMAVLVKLEPLFSAAPPALQN